MNWFFGNEVKKLNYLTNQIPSKLRNQTFFFLTQKVSLNIMTEEGSAYVDEYGIPPHEEYEVEEEAINNEKDILIKDPEGTASPISSIFNLANTTVGKENQKIIKKNFKGAGIVAIPLTIHQAGLVLGLILVFIFGLLASYTLHLLIYASTKTKKYSFKDLAIDTFGPIAGYIFELAILLLTFGVCTVFVILISKN